MQFNTKSPTIKRILREASELSTSPSGDYHATPLEANLFEWHFTVRGPPGSAYSAGLYHGRISLPATYPLRPPSFRFLTPSGRFEANREICLSISGHHEETWQPAWGIRTALVALRAFMAQEAHGQLGGLECTEQARARLAVESLAWRCVGCGGRSNREIMGAVEAEMMMAAARGPGQDQDDGTRKEGAGEGAGAGSVPSELRLAFRDEMAAAAAAASGSGSASASGSAPGEEQIGEQAMPGCGPSTPSAPPSQPLRAGPSNSVPPLPPPSSSHVPPSAAVSTSRATSTATTLHHPAPRPTTTTNTTTTNTTTTTHAPPLPSWIDKAISGIVACLAIMILKKVFHL
ncbi:MAG: hypothetical protein M1826_004210 [Phylliscum demangeonii]|nr:MAG: hypothetical protein M1826_004210 [Phylliscum demangeonii]